MVRRQMANRPTSGSSLSHHDRAVEIRINAPDVPRVLIECQRHPGVGPRGAFVAVDHALFIERSQVVTVVAVARD